MVVGPGVVSNPSVNSVVWVACPLGTKLPNGPFVAVFAVEKGDETVERVAVGQLWVSD